MEGPSGQPGRLESFRKLNLLPVPSQGLSSLIYGTGADSILMGFLGG